MVLVWLALFLALAGARRPAEDLPDGRLVQSSRDQVPSSVLGSSVNDCDRENAILKVVLQNLGVADDVMHGDHCQWEGIECVEDEQCVQWIDLGYKNLTGRLSAEFGKLTRLTHLWLNENRHLSGDIRTLSALTRLEQLHLPNTLVTGVLEALQNLTQMKWLDLYQTKVDGKLGALVNLKELVELDLSRTAINGRLEDLKNFTHATHIILAETQTSGELKALTDLRKLTNLDLSKTDTTGDIEDLLHYEDLEQALLRRTEVSGRLTSQWHGRLRRLSVLDLADTHARFVATAEDTVALNGFELLPSLTFLDVSGCPLNSPVQNLLWPFAESEHLERVDAARSNLTGTLPHLGDHALTDSLQRLDLSYNRINYVEGLPEGLVARGRLSLAKNPNISFAPGVLARAIRHRVKIDLRGASLAKTTQDASRLHLLTKLREKTPPTKSDHGSLQCKTFEGIVYDIFLTDQVCRPSPGYALLEATDLTPHQCFFPAEERCNSTNSIRKWKELGCAEGYEGVLCSMCADQFRSSAGRCKRCKEDAATVRWWLAGAGAVVLVALVAAGLYVAWGNRSKRLPETQKPKPMDALIPLLLGQGPVLVQFVQLWAILAALGPAKTAHAADEQLQEELSQWLELTAAGISDALSIQCLFGRTLALSFSAFASPSLPLLLLMLCFLLEALDWSGGACWHRPGLGVDLALKVLLFLFIGGASSCEKLLRCQKIDAGGEELGDYAYRFALPQLRCSDSTSEEAVWAIYVGYGSAVAYGLLIPSFLIYLIVKQNIALAPNRRCVSWAKVDRHKNVTVRASLLEPLMEDGETDEEIHQQKRTVSDNLLAAAIAYSAVFLHGHRVHIVQDAKAEALMLEGTRIDDGSSGLEFDAATALTTGLSAISTKEHKIDTAMRRFQAITRMLAEREMLEAKADSDRVLAGAKTIFFKYAACEDVWVEALLKVVAVALVTTVSVKSLLLTLFITVGMAILLGAQKPYQQRQVNDLQSGCFICLSVAAVGLTEGCFKISRCVLVIPFVAACVQMLRPDGAEALALRLHKEAKTKLKEGNSLDLEVKKIDFI
ncbi:RLP35 [Symbiodinium sp. CCMP2592]|nr:RLP35 [Symbiodinium sp. CCMP2592]